MRDVEKQIAMCMCEKRLEIVGALSQEDGSTDTYSSVWDTIGRYGRLHITPCEVNGIRYALLSRRELTDQDVEDWVAVQKLSCEDED